MEQMLAMKRQAEEMQEEMRKLQSFVEASKKKETQLKQAAQSRPQAAKASSNRTSSQETGSSLFGKRPGSAGKARAAAAAHSTNGSPAAESVRAATHGADSAAAAAAQPAQSAEQLREQGNRLFKAGRYGEARQAYSDSISAAETCLAFANRAMAELKLRDWNAAESDCTRAIELDATYIKAYQRRSAARVELGRMLEAVDDLDVAVRLQPSNHVIASERAALIHRYHDQPGAPPRPVLQETVAVQVAQQQQQQAPASSAAVADASATSTAGQSAAAPQQPTSQPLPAASAAAAQAAKDTAADGTATAASTTGANALSRLAAQPAAEAHHEPAQPASPALQPQPLGASHAEGTVGSVAPTTASAHQPKRKVEGLVNNAGVIRPAAAAAPSASVTSASSAPVNGEDVKGSKRPSPLEDVMPAGVSSSPAATAHAAASPVGGSPVPPVVQIAVSAQPQKPQQAARAANGQTLPDVAAATPAKLVPPTTGLEWERTWRMLAGQPQRQTQYLLLLKPATLPALFKHSLTAALLEGMLPLLLAVISDTSTASGGEGPQQAAALLEALPKVPRFDLVVMSLGAARKQRLGQLWDEASAAVETKEPIAQSLAAARAKFRL